MMKLGNVPVMHKYSCMCSHADDLRVATRGSILDRNMCCIAYLDKLCTKLVEIFKHVSDEWCVCSRELLGQRLKKLTHY